MFEQKYFESNQKLERNSQRSSLVVGRSAVFVWNKWKSEGKRGYTGNQQSSSSYAEGMLMD